VSISGVQKGGYNMPSGVYTHKKNRVFSEEHRKHLKENNPHYWKGKHHSIETMAKWKPGYNKQGEYIGFKKGELNPSCKPERRKAISEWRKNNKLSPITRKRIGISLSKTLKNPELRTKFINNLNRGRVNLQTLAIKQKISYTRRKNHPPSIKRLIQILDQLFSQYKRLSNMDKQGFIRCFTCGGFFSYREIDCGHFASRMHKGTRYMEENTEPQCRKCNRFLEGVKDVFALNLQKKYGVDILQKINDKKNTITKFTATELEQLILSYKQKLKEV